ncbi:MAG: T9SS type A sorting domain-containing protein [Flavobacteriales bacterium]|nr:T9SS type A sorting domain-containing protein [Flavobacteriales bacterium]
MEIRHFTFLWDDGLTQTTQTAVGLASGVFTVTVTDSNGCSDTGIAVLNDPGAPALTISSTSLASCNGMADGAATVSISGATGPFTYTWSTTPTQTDSVATGLAAGTYSVNVTAGGVCTASITTTISQPDLLIAFVGGTGVSCIGENDGQATVAVSGGVMPYSYTWSTGQTFPIIDSLIAGTYYVNCTDANGCVSEMDSVVISDPAPITIANIVTAVTCNGDSNGAIILAVSGGQAPLSYNWSNGSTTKDISNLVAGTYVLVLTDANSCTQTESITVGTLSAGVQTSPITGPNAVNQTSNHFYAVALDSGSIYNWIIQGGIQTGGGVVNSISVQWDSVGTGQVAVVETDSMGCVGDTVILNVSVAAYTSQLELYAQQIEVQVYPNPTSGQFNLKILTNEVTPMTIRMYNFTGQLIHAEEIEATKSHYIGHMNLSGYAKGVYYIQIISERSTSISRIIIE